MYILALVVFALASLTLVTYAAAALYSYYRNQQWLKHAEPTRPCRDPNTVPYPKSMRDYTLVSANRDINDGPMADSLVKSMIEPGCSQAETVEEFTAADEDFNIPRERYTEHTANPFCKSCHAAIDGVKVDARTKKRTSRKRTSRKR